jgi:hypothetical protein
MMLIHPLVVLFIGHAQATLFSHKTRATHTRSSARDSEEKTREMESTDTGQMMANT